MTDPRKVARESNKLEKRLLHGIGRAIADFSMIGAGERVMVCLSGGKDSYTLLRLLTLLWDRAPVDFEINAVHLDQKQPGYPAGVMQDYLEGLGVPYAILEQDTYSIVTERIPEDKTYCGLCSRLRRGILYRHAREIGATRIALGHHRDDIVETLFLNLFYGGRLKAMPARLKSDDGANVVIRPLAYCAEKDIERYSTMQGFPIIPCNLCGSQDGLKRVQIKAMLAGWEREQPGRTETIFRSLTQVVPEHLLDTNLVDFAALERDQELIPLRQVPDAQTGS